MIKGDKYYFVNHAYHHYIGEVIEILGVKHCKLINVVKIHSCRRNWTQFFADGMRDDTQYDVIPDGHEINGYINLTPWHHDIPTTRS